MTTKMTNPFKKHFSLFLLFSVLLSLTVFANDIEQGGTGEVTLKITGISGTASTVHVGGAAGSNADYIDSNTSGSFSQSGSTLTIKFDVTLTSDAPVGNMNVYFTVLIITPSVTSNMIYSVAINVIESTGTKADFIANATNAFTTIPVNFTDKSSGEITNWLWDFGDGDTNEEQNPSHLYTEAGTYSVSLIVKGDEGSDTITKQDYITVKIPEIPNANFTVDKTNVLTDELLTFTNLSTGDVTEWLWDFGDGNTSTEQHPTHSYIIADTYAISLIIIGPAGRDTLIQEDYVIVSYAPPVANFSADETSGSIGVSINFTDNSTGKINSWSWDFGDNSTSMEQNPSHTYNEAGNYTVSLTVIGDGGSDTKLKTEYITVTVPAPIAEFSVESTSGDAPFAVNFRDESTGTITAWLWDFGDDYSSNEANPTHIYEYPGNYTVSLTVSNAYGSDTEIKTNMIVVNIIPVWKFEGMHDRSSPAIGNDGTLYIDGSEWDNGLKIYCYALNPNGSLNWKYEMETSTSPTLGKDGTIYIGGGIDDKFLYALNPDGTLKWKYETGDAIYSSPAIGNNGIIYVGSNDKYLYALNPNGTLKWKYETNHFLQESPSIGTDGTIYSYCDDGFLYALNPDGTFKWKYETWGNVQTSPAIGSDDVIYVGTGQFLYALNPDGTLKWREIHLCSSSPVIGSNGTIYIGSSKFFKAFNSDGTLKWKYETNDFVSSTAAIGSNGTIYVGSDDFYFYAFNPDGTIKWNYDTDGRIGSSPTISKDGTIYIVNSRIVENYENYLYAFSTNNKGLANSPWPCFRQNTQRTSRLDKSEPTSSITQTLENSVQIYPNPTKGIAQIDGLPFNDKVLISAYSSLGKLVSQFENTGSNAIIDISGQSPGIYLIKIDGKTQQTVKVIKE